MNWFKQQWVSTYGPFPSDYLSLDLEASGPDTDKDLIVECGWCRVKDNKVVDNDSILLNWIQSPYVDTNWLKKRMIETSDKMLKKRGHHYPFTFEGLAKGVSPIKGLSSFLELLIDCKENNTLLVTHNGIGFDFVILKRHFKKLLKIDYDFDPDLIIDSGAIEKGEQSYELLCNTEKAGHWAYRILMRTGDWNVAWGLHDYCIPKYDLERRFNLDKSQYHTSKYDTYITSLLYQEYKALSEQ